MNDLSSAVATVGQLGSKPLPQHSTLSPVASDVRQLNDEVRDIICSYVLGHEAGRTYASLEEEKAVQEYRAQIAAFGIVEKEVPPEAVRHVAEELGVEVHRRECLSPCTPPDWGGSPVESGCEDTSPAWYAPPPADDAQKCWIPVENTGTLENPCWRKLTPAERLALLAVLMFQRRQALKLQDDKEDLDPTLTNVQCQDCMEDLKKKWFETPALQLRKTERKWAEKPSKERIKMCDGWWRAHVNASFGWPRESFVWTGDESGHDVRSPNVFGEVLAHLILATGCCGQKDLKRFKTVYDEERRGQQRNEEADRHIHVQEARKLRKAGRAGNTAFLRAGLEVSPFRNTLPLPAGGVNYVPFGLCRGEVHGDRVCGKRLVDQLYCQWCYDLEQVTRYLCPECRRTDSPDQQAHCLHPCPAKQRTRNGRTPRSRQLPCTGPTQRGALKRKLMPESEKALKQYFVKARWSPMMTTKWQERGDEATRKAGAGRLRSGGTAIGTSPPPQGQLARCLGRFFLKRRSQ